jgi:hypothetical protein
MRELNKLNYQIIMDFKAIFLFMILITAKIDLEKNWSNDLEQYLYPWDSSM